MTFLFVEAKTDRAEFLESEIATLAKSIAIPDWVTVLVRNGEFVDVVGELLDFLDESGARGLAPTFAFIDPFGFSGVPMELVARIVKHDKCECLVTFMYNAINRFLAHPNEKIAAHYDDLFGTKDWRELSEIADPAERQNAIVELYRRQLQAVGGLSHVRTFEMINDGNRTEYYLYFGTNSEKGLSVMKQAMWRADPAGGRVFSDRTEGQMVLIETGAEAGLREELVRRYSGRGWTPIEDIMNFVLVETPFSEVVHLKRRTLGVMEKADPPEIEVRGRKINRAGAYPAGTEIRLV